ncbi:MAG: ribulose-phosphate 3-epimerase, partial [Bullifex sp.]
MLKLAPSILSCSFANVKKAVDEVDSLGLEYLHLDVMDGSFVPEITFGAKLVRDIRRYSDITFDCHLMTVRPEDKIKAFIDAGADIITIHQEATVHLHRVMQEIKNAGVKCGISIVPSTPVSAITPLLEMADLVLVMTVNPGYGGQKLIQSCLDKVVELKDIREKEDYSYLISVDGGVSLSTIQDVATAGADIAVTGSAFFSAEDREAFVNEMNRLIGECM